MKVEVLKQYSVFLPNEPGALGRLSGEFAKAGVSLIGISSEVRDDSAMVRIAVGAEGDFSSVLGQAGFASIESKLVSVEVPDRPGALAMISDALALGKVNITNVYGTALHGGTCRILFAVENTAKALKILERMKAG
ncbi:MAG: ACT domain-containing protein [Elusimicrobia bacterium]|nr:ACT domain-containing protein [Elusimicrobiota bacterium]